MLYSDSIGSGKTAVIFVHGASQDSRTWRFVLDTDLLGQYQLVTLDLPGHGQSHRSLNPRNDYSIKGIGTHLSEFLEQQNFTDFIVVTTSISSIYFAEALPLSNACKGVFMIGCCVLGEVLTPANVLQPLSHGAVGFMSAPSDEQMEEYLDEVILDKGNSALRQSYKKAFFNTDPAFRVETARQIENAAWSDEIKLLNEAGFPVAIVYGKMDAIVQPDYLMGIRLNKWRDKIITIEDAGHSLQLDRPEKTAALIKDFADECFK